MAEELLNGPVVVAILEEVGGEAVAERVRCGRLGDSSGSYGVSNGALDDALMKMMPAPGSTVGMVVEPRRGEDPLPWPGVGGARTCLKKKRMALNAWFWVEALTLWRAKAFRNVVTSLCPMSSRRRKGAWSSL